MLTATGAETAGLCSTCNNRSSCVYREKRGKDAIYCEMFDCCSNGNRDSTTEDRMAVDKKASSEYKGLCANCVHRETCVLHRPEGGVWHCEEYE